MLEEELKNRIAQRYFKKFDCAGIIKRIDFTVKSARTNGVHPDEYFLWAEAKQQPTDVYKMLTQLIVTIKQDAYNILPPKFVGCFDSEKIAFVEYNEVLPIYAVNDFNWSQTPSQVDDKSVATVKKIIDRKNVITFYYGKDDDEIRNFVEQNFIEGGSLLSTLIDKNNFIFVYQKWREMVMPSINADWDKLKANYGVYDRDFFLAELNIDDNNTTDLNDDEVAYPDFYITFNANSPTPYMMKRTDALRLDVLIPFKFRHGGIEKYAEFWKRYKRPPQNIYWNYIISRLDLLVPQDVRERKGAFFTPQIWVEKSQRYIADVLGDDWQENYYIWDCCAGTGNLLNGLSDKYKIFASTLDQQDVDVMKDRIKNGANLLESHVFQFDFLNDDFLPNDDTVETPHCDVSTHGKLPPDLYKIISDPEKRKRLVIYINPPYAEAGDAKQLSGSGKNKTDVAVTHKTYSKYLDKIGIAGRELFAQFFIRIYCEIPNCILAEFSTLKILQGPNFNDFRNVFKANLKKSFIVPANTFDNVKGKFPIGFFIWNCNESDIFKETKSTVYDENGSLMGEKVLSSNYGAKTLTDWMISTRNRPSNVILGFNYSAANDFQHNNYNRIETTKEQLPSPRGTIVTDSNLIESCIYIAVRHVIAATWLNDRDQYLYPNDGWKTDNDFQTNCFVWTLFNNNIQTKYGTNHWIPFSEMEVEARGLFDSHFMNDYITGRGVPCARSANGDLFSDGCELPQQNQLLERAQGTPLQFSETAQSVLSAGRDLWRYYHTMEDANTNASLVDIKEYFQGRNEKGTMNSTSNDPIYTSLLENLKTALRALGEKIKPKVYEYGFLR